MQIAVFTSINLFTLQAEDAQTQLRTSEKMSKETTVKLAQVISGTYRYMYHKCSKI